MKILKEHVVEGFELIRFHDGCGSDLQWFDLYERHPDWKKIVTPESFSHPAKMSPRLCEAIFEHLEALQLINQDSTVCDFMSGTGTTNIIASMRGYRSVSVELESKFAHIQMKNREGVARFDGNEPEWRILQGDARNLSKMLNGGVAVMSPPYGAANQRIPLPGDATDNLTKRGYQRPDGSYDTGILARTGYRRNTHSSEGNIGLLGVTSPPYFQQGNDSPPSSAMKTNPSRMAFRNLYGKTKGQIGKLGIVSPPYMGASDRQTKAIWGTGFKAWKGEHEDKPRRTYGNNPRQIGNLPAITSPPYANRFDRGNESQRMKEGTMQHDMNTGGYSMDPRNIGNTKMVAVTSPPYADQRIATNPTDSYTKLWEKHGGKGSGDLNRLGKSQVGYNKGPTLWSKGSKKNIGNLPAITSPPYQNMVSSPKSKNRAERLRKAGYDPKEFMATPNKQTSMDMRYSASKENLGNQKPEDYSSAMLKVYHEAFLAGISPLVTVTKNPTRNGKLVRLDLLTADLLTRAGYELFDYHQPVFASVRKEEEASIEEGKTITTPSIYGKMGFFKILQVQKGQGEVAQWEDVIFARIPSYDGGRAGDTSPPYQDMVKTGAGPGATSTHGVGPERLSSQSFYGKHPRQIGNLR